MLHHNHAPHPLTFTLRGVSYVVGAGEEIDIPSRVAYAVPASLRPVPGAVREPVEDDASAEVWRGRCAAAVARAERAESAVARAEQGEAVALDTLAQEREARDGFVAQLREALSIAPAESIFAAIAALRADVEAATAPAPAAKPAPNAGKGGR